VVVAAARGCASGCWRNGEKIVDVRDDAPHHLLDSSALFTLIEDEGLPYKTAD
jgi:hypothetical protein